MKLSGWALYAVLGGAAYLLYMLSQSQIARTQPKPLVQGG